MDRIFLISILLISTIFSLKIQAKNPQQRNYQMKTLDELLNTDEPAIELIKEWISKSPHNVEILPPSENRTRILESLHITTRSPLGAIAYETGGILIDNGWIRFLGSGNTKLKRNIVDWNHERSSGFLLVADDMVGGFFAINGGTLGPDTGKIYYWSPDFLEWEPLDIGFTDFFVWALSEKINEFYLDLGKEKLSQDYNEFDSDKCFSFYPFLWTEEGSVEKSSIGVVPIEEAFGIKNEIAESAR